MSKKLFRPEYTTEGLAFQNKNFHAELTMAIESCRGMTQSQVLESNLDTRLAGIIDHYLNMKFSFDFGTFGPAVLPPMINRNNVMIMSMHRNYHSSADGIRLIKTASGAISGSLDLRTGKASGIFSQIVSRVYLPIIDIINPSRFTPGELAATLLHEIGHIWWYFYFISFTATTNQVIAGVSKGLDGSDDINGRIAILTTAQKELNLPDLKPEELAKSKNKTIIETVIVTNAVLKSRSLIGSDIYDQTSWEALSDQFAQRWGAGLDLVTALDKLYRGSFNIAYRNMFVFMFYEAVKIAMMFVLPAISLLLIAADARPDAYDTPEARIKRIRDQMVEQAKDKKLPAELITRVLEDIDHIDSILESINDKRQLLAVFGDVVIPSMRNSRKQEMLQKDLEALAFNDLFIKSSELKQLN